MKHNTQVWASYLAALVVVVVPFSAAAKPSKQSASTKKQLKAMVPIFDTSGMPKRSHFTLQIKHTRILMPEDPEVLLHGNHKLIQIPGYGRQDVLSGSAETKQRDTLKGKTEVSQPKQDLLAGKAKEDHLSGNAKQDLIAGKAKQDLLKGKAKEDVLTASAKTDSLKARVAENAHHSIIGTVEHSITPRFSVDLRKLTPHFAPDIARLMNTEIAEARRKAADDVAERQKQMNLELSTRQLRLPSTMPAQVSTGTTPGSVPDTKPLEAKLAESKRRQKQDATTAEDQLKIALAGARSTTSAKIPTLPVGPLVPAVPKLPTMPTGPASPNVPRAPLPQRTVTPALSIPSVPQRPDTAAAEREMAAQLNRAKVQPPVNTSTTIDLNSAKQIASQLVRNAKPTLDTILTSLRQLPDARMPGATNQQPVDEEDKTSVLKWDQWHARFAELAQQPILKAVSKYGNPSGVNTIEITVWPDQHLSARITQPGNVAFDKAILQAYQSLDRNPQLKYPAGSRRTVVTFQIDNKHEGTGLPSGVQSLTSVGDQELLHGKR